MEKLNSKYFLKGINGQITIEENFIVIDRKGFTGFVGHGLKGAKRIPISSIRAIQLKRAGLFFNGYIQLTLPGGNENTGGIFKATQDENTVMFKIQDNDMAEDIKNYIEDKLIQLQSGNTIVNQKSSADEILKYKQLFDDGIITEEQFEKKKNELLNL